VMVGGEKGGSPVIKEAIVSGFVRLGGCFIWIMLIGRDGCISSALLQHMQHFILMYHQIVMKSHKFKWQILD
jgi:hypothetical protein